MDRDIVFKVVFCLLLYAIMLVYGVITMIKAYKEYKSDNQYEFSHYLRDYPFGGICFIAANLFAALLLLIIISDLITSAIC